VVVIFDQNNCSKNVVDVPCGGALWVESHPLGCDPVSLIWCHNRVSGTHSKAQQIIIIKVYA